MNGSASVLAWAEHPLEGLKQAVERRMAEHGLTRGSAQVRLGKLGDQIELHRAGTLFDLAILPRRLDHSTRSIEAEVVGFLEGADFPVLVAGDVDSKALRRILICTRAGEPGKNDINLGGRFSRHLGSQVTLLYVTRGRADLAPRKKGMASLAAQDVPSEILVAHGEPVDEILAAAYSHDLIVIGGHGPKSRSVFGRTNVTREVLEECEWQLRSKVPAPRRWNVRTSRWHSCVAAAGPAEGTQPRSFGSGCAGRTAMFKSLSFSRRFLRGEFAQLLSISFSGSE
jgi:nucleotide-binding universal stress UspA family protein